MGLELLLPFVGGLIYGSFLNVVVFRFDDWLSILQGRSECPDCKTQLAWYDLLPVVSFVSLSGKCRYCRKPISYQYPLVEVATAIFLALGYQLIFTAGLSLTFAAISYTLFIIVFGALVVIFCHDLREMMVPDVASYALIIGAALFGYFFRSNVVLTIWGGLIAVLPIALLVYPSRGKWMGEGDVKLALGLGLLVGYPNAIVLLITAFMSGAIIGLLLVIIKEKTSLKSAVPFAPFLIIGALVALFYGDALVHWYTGMLGIY